MKIAIVVEGKTEQAFLPHLRGFLKTRSAGRMPKLDPFPHDGRIPTGRSLKRIVEQLLSYGKVPADAVIALTDVYTGTNPPDFADAADAKEKMCQWVGPDLGSIPTPHSTTSKPGYSLSGVTSSTLRSPTGQHQGHHRNGSTTIILLRTGSARSSGRGDSGRAYVKRTPIEFSRTKT